MGLLTATLKDLLVWIDLMAAGEGRRAGLSTVSCETDNKGCHGTQAMSPGICPKEFPPGSPRPKSFLILLPVSLPPLFPSF